MSDCKSWTVDDAAADDAFYGHCECGCGRSLHDTAHKVVIGITGIRFRAVDSGHAFRIIDRLARAPFEAVGLVNAKEGTR